MRSEVALARARLGYLDFGLSALASVLTVFSLGQGLNETEIGRFFVLLVIAGSVFSLAIHRILPEKSLPYMGILYAGVALGAFAFRVRLNGLLPGEGIPQELIVAGALAWMIGLGSFFMWQDSSMMFQSVPSVALFGLIGAWDTFREAPIAFFGFLMCFATMFARAHARLMLAQAGESGFAHDHERPDSLMMRLKDGPWRFVAGPGWALLSALAVVLLSLIGTPVIKGAVEGVAGNMRIAMPVRPSRPTRGAIQGTSGDGLSYVGRGPRQLRNTPYLITNVAEQTYFRGRTFARFRRDYWIPLQPYQTRLQYIADRAKENSLLRRTMDANEEGSVIPYRASFVTSSFNPGSVPIPGFATAKNGDSMTLRPDATVQIVAMQQEFQVTVFQPQVPAELGAAPKDLPAEYYGGDDDLMPQTVTDFVFKATANAKTDFEKARAIKEAIEGQVGYDLGAEPTPEGADPVNHFLFVSKRGYCDLFATAMTRCARLAGLPARYVTGYFPVSNTRDNQRNLVLLESEAHAWCEIYFEGAGWVVFDATEGAPNVGKPTDDEGTSIRNTVAMVIGGLFVLVAPYYAYRWWQAQRNPVDPVRKKLAKSFAIFIRAIEKKTRKPRRPSQTPEEYVLAIRSVLGDQFEPALALARRFGAAFYGPDKPDWEILERDAREFAKTCRR